MRRVTTCYAALSPAEQARLDVLAVRYWKDTITDDERAEYFDMRDRLLFGPDFIGQEVTQ